MQQAINSPASVNEAPREDPRDMTQTMSILVGALLTSISLCETLVPSFMDMKLSILHSVILGLAGVLLLYNGLKANAHASFLTCLSYGIFFGAWSALGFIFGEHTHQFVLYDRTDDFMVNFIPGFNATGSFNHGIHAVLAVVLLLGAYDWRRHHKGEGSFVKFPFSARPR